MSAFESGIGTDVVAWFQGANPILSWVLAPFHFLGGPYGYLVVLPVIYWSLSKRDGKRLMVMALGSALVGQYLKFVFHRPRPADVSPSRVEPVFHEIGFGMPSGHTILGTVVAGYVWYSRPTAWVRISAVAFAVVMGISRMVHGLHFPQDVVAGFLIGLVFIVIFWWVDTRHAMAWEKLPPGPAMVLFAAIAVAAFLLTLVTTHDLEDRKATLSIVGALLGGLTGFRIETALVRFSHAGPVWNRILRTVVGMVMTVGLFVGLDVLYDIVTGGALGTGAMVVYVIRYALVAAFVTVGAPALFVRFGLARTDDGS